jgi:hypothetical protein
MDMGIYAVILFFSNNVTIWASTVLRKSGVEHKMIPAPRHLSSDCGYCIRIQIEDVTNASAILKSHKVEYDRIEKI